MLQKKMYQSSKSSTRHLKRSGLLLLFVAFLAIACTTDPQTVETEVTRVVTRTVDVPNDVEVTRIVTNEVEVTRIVEVEMPAEDNAPAEEASEAPAPPPPYEPPTTIVADGLANPRQLFYDADGTLYIAEAGTSGEFALTIDEENSVQSGLTSQISMLESDSTWSVVVPGLPSMGNRGARGGQAILVTDDSYWVGIGEAPPQLFGLSLFYTVLEIDRDTLRIKNIIDTAAAATEAGQPNPNALNSDPTDLALDENGTLFIADAGCNCLWTWTEVDGIALFHAWDEEDNPVPTGVDIAPDGSIYVSFLSGFPFPTEGTRIEQYAPDGTLTQTFDGLTLLTDVMVADDGTVYAVEMASGFGDTGFIADSGRVVTVSADGITPVLEGLRTPYGIAQAPDGTIVVSVNGAMNPTATGMVIVVE